MFVGTLVVFSALTLFPVAVSTGLKHAGYSNAQAAAVFFY